MRGGRWETRDAGRRDGCLEREIREESEPEMGVRNTDGRERRIWALRKVKWCAGGWVGARIWSRRVEV